MKPSRCVLPLVGLLACSAGVARAGMITTTMTFTFDERRSVATGDIEPISPLTGTVTLSLSDQALSIDSEHYPAYDDTLVVLDVAFDLPDFIEAAFPAETANPFAGNAFQTFRYGIGQSTSFASGDLVNRVTANVLRYAEDPNTSGGYWLHEAEVVFGYQDISGSDDIALEGQPLRDLLSAAINREAGTWVTYRELVYLYDPSNGGFQDVSYEYFGQFQGGEINIVPDPSAVPEPSSLALLASGGLIGALRMRRRKAAA